MNEAPTQAKGSLFDHSLGVFAVLGFLAVVGAWQAFLTMNLSHYPTEEDQTSASLLQAPSVSTPSISEPNKPQSDQQIIQGMAEYLIHNPRAAIALANLSQPRKTSKFFDIDLDNPIEFTPENAENLEHRMSQIAAENPEKLAHEFKEKFTILSSNQAEERVRLLQLARAVGDSPAGDSVKEVVLQQASLFIPSQDPGDSTFGKNSLQTYLDMEKDPVKRKAGASRVTSIFIEINSP